MTKVHFVAFLHILSLQWTQNDLQFCQIITRDVMQIRVELQLNQLKHSETSTWILSNSLWDTAENFQTSFCWLWWYSLSRIPGMRAAHAMPPSLSDVDHVRMSLMEVICDRRQPVWTQMKLYGIKPEKKGMGLHVRIHCPLVWIWKLKLQLTYKHRREEQMYRYVNDGWNHVHEPIGRHWKQTKEEQEEEQSIWVFSNLCRHEWSN